MGRGLGIVMKNNKNKKHIKKFITDYSMILSELTLKEKNTFLDWGIKYLENPKEADYSLCFFVGKWMFSTNVMDMYFSRAYNTILFPELLKKIEEEVISSGGCFEVDKIGMDITSSPIGNIPIGERITYRVALLKDLKREINNEK